MPTKTTIPVDKTPGESDDTHTRLARRFKASDIEMRSGFHYLTIDSVIKRFNEVCGLSYSFQLDSMTVSIAQSQTSGGKTQYQADAYGHVTVYTPFHTATRAGSGSAINFDVDNAVKTAQAEVMKKAGHQFGVGLYLWDDDERHLVDLVRSAEASGNLPDYKKAVQVLATIEGVSPLSAKNIAAHFGLAAEDALQEVAALRSILGQAGLV